MNDRLYLQAHGPAIHLVYNRPDRKNAFCKDMWEAVPDLVAQAVAKKGARLLVLTSSTPGIFSAGADLAEFERFLTDHDGRRENYRAIGQAAISIAECPLPVLAAIDGACMGGGYILAGAADIRVASDRARFGFPPAKLGLLYHYVAMKHLLGLIGPAQTKKLLMTASVILAQEALSIGLIEECVPQAGLKDRVDELAHTISSLSAAAIEGTKTQIHHALSDVPDDLDAREAEFLAAHDGAEHLEGLNAFKEKRPPRFD